MRKAQRPLKTIARPLVSLTEMNTVNPKERDDPVANPGESVTTIDALRREYFEKGAISMPLVMKRRDMKELRYHIFRLQAKGQLDIQDPKQFTPPIRLHRRDPRAPPSGAGAHYEEEETKEDLEEIKERERLEIAKEERRKIREMNLAMIAPSGVRKPPAFQKKTEQKFRPDDTPEAEKRRLLKYEETLPWHLEDFDNKQTWVGVYESELSEAHVMLTAANENGQRIMQMVPLERWYKFNNKKNIKQITADQADEFFKKEEKLPSFLTNIERISVKREQEHAVRGHSRMMTRVGGGDDDEGAAPRKRKGDDDKVYIKREADADDIDFNMEEDFADDEEGLNGLFEGDDVDVKEASDRLKRDHLGANSFAINRDDEEIERQEEKERQEAENQKKLEKSIRKALTKREKNPDYDYRSDRSNPYESSSEESETDSEAERQKAKEEAEKKAVDANGKVDADKPASGASSKGSNTPSGLHKSGDVNKKKRPGSPNLSEASGNESSRKKHKKKHDKNAEGDDASKPKKKHALNLKLGGGTPSGSPGGSRAASPAPSRLNDSRAGSPASAAAARKSYQSTVHLQTVTDTTIAKVLPSAAEVYRTLPPEGMQIQQLIKTFKGRVDKTNTQAFIRLVKAVAVYEHTRMWLTPLPVMPSEEEIQKRTRKPAAKSAAASPSAS